MVQDKLRNTISPLSKHHILHMIIHMKPRKRVFTAQTKTKKRSFPISGILKVMLMLIITLIILFSIIKAVSIISQISNTSFDNPLSNAKNVNLVKYGNVTRTMFIFVNSKDQISFVSVFINNSESAEILHYYIPGWVYMPDYSTSFDEEVPVKNLIYAGDLLNPARKYEYAIWQIINLTGISIDSYVIVNENSASLNCFSKLLDTSLDPDPFVIKRESFFRSYDATRCLFNENFINTLSSTVKTNLSLSELDSRIASIRDALNGRVYRIALNETAYLRDGVSKTGELIQKVNYLEADEVLQEYSSVIRSKQLQMEQVKVEVYNGSSVSKAGERYARRIANSGCYVLRYGNAPVPYDKTNIIIMDEDKYSESLRLVEDIFAIEPEKTATRPNFMTTGDIILILGKDIGGEISWE